MRFLYSWVRFERTTPLIFQRMILSFSIHQEYLKYRLLPLVSYKTVFHSRYGTHQTVREKVHRDSNPDWPADLLCRTTYLPIKLYTLLVADFNPSARGFTQDILTFHNVRKYKHENGYSRWESNPLPVARFLYVLWTIALTDELLEN